MSRDKSPKRLQCEHCEFNNCPSLKHYTKIPAVGANDYEIADEKSKKRLCCRCIQVMDFIKWGESSDKKQCATCKTSTRVCSVCKKNECEDLAVFDVGYEGYADEEGYYCCLHRNYCRTFNSDRFEVFKCKPCEQRSTFDYLNTDCSLIHSSDSEYHCDSCQSNRVTTVDCECCGNDCCLQCHDVQSETPFCQRCFKECDPENGEYWHAKKE